MSTCGSHDENDMPPTGAKRKQSALLYPTKRPRNNKTDPMVGHGKHFGRAVNAVTNMKALITGGLDRMTRIGAGESLEEMTRGERREQEVFEQLLAMISGLDERLADASDEDHGHICAMLQKGIDQARTDDTKGLKSAIIDWIAPLGQAVNPPLSRSNKSDRGYHHEMTGKLLCPAAWDWGNDEVKAGLRSGQRLVPGEHWPLFVFENHLYDPEDPWAGLFKGSLLVTAYKYIFTSPSSVENKEVKATRSGNARIHGMTQVSEASIAYVATLVRFSLSSTSVFSRTDYVTDSERFYNTVMDLLTDVRELSEVNALKVWWNRKIFPASLSIETPLLDNTPLARIRARRDRLEKAAAVSAITDVTNSTNNTNP